MGYRFQLRDTTTGETAVCELDVDPPNTGAFWWLEGNGCCDCNRGEWWDRAHGVSEEEIDARDDADKYPCGPRRGRPQRFALDWVEADGVRFIENGQALDNAG